MGADKLIIFLTKRCTRDCAFCVDKQNVKYYKDERYRAGFMEDDSYFRALDFAVGNGIRRIQFNGGEPTLHPGLLSWSGAAPGHIAPGVPGGAGGLDDGGVHDRAAAPGAGPPVPGARSWHVFFGDVWNFTSAKVGCTFFILTVFCRFCW